MHPHACPVTALACVFCANAELMVQATDSHGPVCCHPLHLRAMQAMHSIEQSLRPQIRLSIPPLP